MLGKRTGVVKLQAPVLLAVVVPSLAPVVLHTVTVLLPAAGPVSVMESLELTAALVMTGAAGAVGAVAAGTVRPSAFDFTLVPAAVVSVAVNAYPPADKSAVVKLQAPAPLAVVVPNGFAPPSDTVTVAPFGEVPVRVTESLELTAPLVMIGAAGGSTVAAGTVTPSVLETALVPPEVVSVAVNA